jgi:hypothetical protein
MTTASNLTTEALKSYVGQADCCKEPLRTGHTYSRVASLIVAKGSQDRVQRFLESLKNHDWGTLRAFNEWSAQSDDLVAHVIRCPNGRGVLVAVLDPAELYANPHILAKRALDEKEIQHLIDLLGDAEWLPLS